MVVHVGIGYNFLSLPVSTYDTINKTYSDFELDSPAFLPPALFKEVYESDIGYIDKIFTEIKLKIDGELGSVCIALDNPQYYPLYKYFVTSAVSHGFKNVQIIDTTSALFYASLCDLNNLPENCDIIQQKRSTKDFKLWQKRSDFVTLKDSINFNKTTIESKIKEGLLCDEAIVIHHKNYNMEQMKNYFPNFDYFSVEGYEKNVGALYKARIMGSDPDLIYYLESKLDVESKHGTSVILQIDDVKILRIEYGEILPLTKILEYELPSANCTLTVITSKNEKKSHTIPSWKKIVILLHIRKDKTFFIKIYKHYKNSLEQIERIFETRRDTYVEISDIYHFPVKIQVNNDEINAFGIDLGTTRCCAAVNRKNGIETLALENTGGRLLPSYVAFDEDHDKCGQIVIDRLRNFGKFSVFDAKRIIGKKYDEIKIDEAWPFEVKKQYFTEILSDGEKREFEETVIEVMTSKGATLKFLDEVSATLLKHIKKCAEEFQRRHLNEVVVTVPAAFNQTQTKATFDAAIHAGFDNAYILPEPVAAAFAYFIDRPIPNNSTLLIFDLGGGTLDVCIAKIEKNQLKIISRSGDPNIGGRDFDNLIVRFLEEKLTQSYGTEMTDAKRLKLLLKSQSLKEYLSILEETNLDAEEIDLSVEALIPITRNQFEEMSANLVQEIRLNVEKALNKINLQSCQIQKVLQVGGGCRMPMIKALLKEMFPNSEHCADQNPDEIVAVGAAYYAYYLYQKDKSKCSVM